MERGLLELFNHPYRKNNLNIDGLSAGSKYLNKNPIQRILIKNFFRCVQQLIRETGIKHILEIGCGDGFVIDHLSKNDLTLKMQGCDIKLSCLKRAKRINPDISFFNADVFDLPLIEKSYDLTLCCEILEHLNKPYKALKEIKRISRKYCLVSVPHEPFFRAANFLRGKNISRWGSDPEYIQYWSEKEFIQMLKTQLEVICVRRPFPWIVALCEA